MEPLRRHTTPKHKLEPEQKIAGKSTQGGLATNPVLPDQVTQRITVRILMELWDPLGRTTSGFLMGLKILFARVCKTVSDSELDTPIVSKDKDLAVEVALFLNNLCN